MSQRSNGSRAGLACWAIAAVFAAFNPASGQTADGAGKIPVTTSSAEARAQYLKGRTLAENLRGQDSREFLLQTAVKDPGFALAHYSLALSARAPGSSFPT